MITICTESSLDEEVQEHTKSDVYSQLDMTSEYFRKDSTQVFRNVSLAIITKEKCHFGHLCSAKKLDLRSF